MTLVPRARPIDLVWAVDTSGSMLEEATAIQEAVNGVTQAISNSGLDVHVVMLAGFPLCIGDGGLCTPGIAFRRRSAPVRVQETANRPTTSIARTWS